MFSPSKNPPESLDTAETERIGKSLKISSVTRIIITSKKIPAKAPPMVLNNSLYFFEFDRELYPRIGEIIASIRISKIDLTSLMIMLTKRTTRIMY